MLIGEMCHFIDLMQYVSGERPVSVFARSLTTGRSDIADHDNVTMVIQFDGGSVGTLCYNTVGDKAASKERLEVYGGGTVVILDDFRVLEIVKNGRRSRQKAMNQEKGQARQIAATVAAFRERGEAPIPFEELVDVMRVVFAARKSMTSGKAVELACTPEPELQA